MKAKCLIRTETSGEGFEGDFDADALNASVLLF
jgi:hypothetical protein